MKDHKSLKDFCGPPIPTLTHTLTLTLNTLGFDQTHRP